MTIRDELINAAKKKIGTRLKHKEDEAMDSFYLDEIKNGNGFFWVEKEQEDKSFRVYLQKITKDCTNLVN